MPAQHAEKSAPEQASRFHLNLHLLSLLSVAFGIAVSGYLSYVRFVNVPMVCVTDGAFNCDVAKNSVYSTFYGIPIAYLGLAMYLVVGALLLLENRVGLFRDHGVVLAFGVVLFAFMYSMFLVYVQFVILQALCMWCLMHETNMVVLFILSSLRLRQVLAELE
jgi:uncharacterized membrane protein